MLKSQVPAVLLSLTLSVALPSAANPGQPVLEAAKAALPTRAAAARSAAKTHTVLFRASATSRRAVSVRASATSRTAVSGRYVSIALHASQLRKFVAAYIRDNDEDLSSVRRRSQRPFRIIDSIFDHYGIPVQMKYLAVIESELKTTALSRVGARGLWQLMPSTARDLGLKVNGSSDERTTYYKSTRAAALYLRDLHNQFKDWLLVLAAYNAGPVPVMRAMRRSHSSDYWVLERFLPTESRLHVKRFLATAWYFDEREPSNDAICAQSPVNPDLMAIPAYHTGLTGTHGWPIGQVSGPFGDVQPAGFVCFSLNGPRTPDDDSSRFTYFGNDALKLID
jgi:soluble lytic murein transglycosylase-like protein